MPTPLREKLGVKPGVRRIVLHAPEDVAALLDLSAEESAKRLLGDFDHIHFFATQQLELGAALPKLRRHLKPNGMLWVSWPKSRQLSTNLNLKEVIRLAYDRRPRREQDHWS